MDAFVLIVSFACTVSCEVGGIPQDFPTFHIPGAENEMSLLRDLFWLHYPGAGPKATLWDEWLPDASLWPAVETEGSLSRMRKAWRTALSARILDPEGYVATHQHASIAHQLGWPFPFSNQGRRGFGWHFSFKNTVGANWRPKDLNRPDGWILYGAKDAGMNDEGWVIQVEQANALITPPKRDVTPLKFHLSNSVGKRKDWENASHSSSGRQPMVISMSPGGCISIRPQRTESSIP